MRDGDELLIAFGAAVRARRESLAGSNRAGVMSQEQLAELAGVHRTYVGGVERGERNVGLLNIDRLATALGMSISELMHEAELRRNT